MGPFFLPIKYIIGIGVMITHKNNGFTLIEIMVATAILAILASIAIPIYRNYTQSAQATECANEVAGIRLAEEEYFLVNNTYFAGADAPSLATNSTGVYVPSPKAAAGTSVCTYSVAPGNAGSGSGTIATQYAINAIPRAGGVLASTTLNLNTCNYAPCP